MKEIKWLKLSNDFFENRKIKSIKRMRTGDKLVVNWLQTICIASKINDNGMIYVTKNKPYTVEELASEFGCKKAIAEQSLEVFSEYDMISINKGFIQVLNWSKYQNSDSLERYKEQSNERVKRFREKHKCNVTSNVTKPLQETLPSNKKEERRKKIEDKDKKEMYKEKIPKKSYGEFDNVSLSDEEFKKLESKNYTYMIERLSSYLESTGKTYKSHYATILSWCRKEDVKNAEHEEHNYNIKRV